MPSRADIAKISGTTPEQRAAWRTAAGGGGRAFSAWARDILDDAARGAPSLPARSAEAAALRAELAGLRSELNRGIGNLLDQVATRLHVDALAGRAPDVDGVDATLAQARGELADLRAAITKGIAVLAPRRTP